MVATLPINDCGVESKWNTEEIIESGQKKKTKQICEILRWLLYKNI